jgi:hypothetical protein
MRVYDFNQLVLLSPKSRVRSPQVGIGLSVFKMMGTPSALLRSEKDSL